MRNRIRRDESLRAGTERPTHSKTTDLAILFDEQFYLRSYPDVAASGWPARLHYLVHGGYEGRNPSPFFDSAYYLASNADVLASGMNPLIHYVQYGAKEGRCPNRFFDPVQYVREKPDVEASGLTPLAHYCITCRNRGDVFPSEDGTKAKALAEPDLSTGPDQDREAVAALSELELQDVKLRLFSAWALLDQSLSSITTLVSVIIPCFNYGRYVWDAISSVLTQTYPHFEVVVIDDGSTDLETIEVLNGIKDPRVRVSHQSNQGLAQSRNNGAAIAQGEYLLYLDADDRLERHALAVLLHALLRRPEAAYAYPQQRFFGDQELVWTPQEFNAYDLLWSNHPSVCSLVRRSAFDEAGGYRPHLLYGYEDWEFWIRLASKGHFGLRVPVPVFEHRRHGVTMTQEAHDRKNFLHSQILALNGKWYQPESITRLKADWRPMVSVIVPVHNRIEYLKDTLASLKAQTVTDFEVILVNDGSDDPETLQYLSSLRKMDWLRVIDREQGGPAAARNTGATLAKAEVLLFLDSDDLLEPSALEKLSWTLSIEPDIAFVYSGVVHFGSMDAIVYDEFDADRLYRENYLTVTCVIRRDVFMGLGGFDSDLVDSHEDYDFWLRLIERGYRGKLFREPLFRYRRHPAGISTERIIAAGGESEQVSESVVRRHRLNTKRPIPLACDGVTSDPLWEELGQTFRATLPPSIAEESYRRPNTPNLFASDRWNRNKTNVLYLLPSFQIGGAEAFDLRIISCLPKDRFSVTLVPCEKPEGPWYEKFTAYVDETFAILRMGPDWHGRLAFLRYLMMSRSVDIVVNRNTEYGYHLSRSWRDLTEDVKFIDLLHVHAHGQDWVKYSVPYHECFAIRYVTSGDLPQYVSQQYGLDPRDFTLLNYGLEPEETPNETIVAGRRRSLRAKWNISESAFVVGFIGRFSEQKDPLRWLNIAADIRSKNPLAVFLMVGGGDLLDEARGSAHQLGLDGKVAFTDFQPLSAHYCAAMDVLLMTSQFEGLPLTILDALAHGTPVVHSDVGSVRAVVSDEVGRVLPLDAPNSRYADEVLAIGRASMRNKAIHSLCRERIVQQYSKAVMCSQLRNDFGRLASSLDREQRRLNYQMSLMAKPILT